MKSSPFPLGGEYAATWRLTQFICMKIFYRLFDSQNNNRGGYNVGEKSMYYYAGSELPIEWTNQHSCGHPNANCEVIIQYMCRPRIRDGLNTGWVNFPLIQIIQKVKCILSQWTQGRWSRVSYSTDIIQLSFFAVTTPPLPSAHPQEFAPKFVPTLCILIFARGAFVHKRFLPFIWIFIIITHWEKLLDSNWLRDCEFIRNLRANSIIWTNYRPHHTVKG